MGFLGRLFGGRKDEGGAPEHAPALRDQFEKGMNGLRAVTAAHDATWHLGRCDWSVDQDQGTIVFADPEGMTATAPVQIIGTYNTQDGSWLWGWDHPSVRAELALHAMKVFEHGQQHGFDRLTTRKLSCTEQEAWELTALAYLLNGANGAYRGPAGTTLVFMTFGQVQLAQA